MALRRIGPYLLVRPLGAGGMGMVWEAWDERLERPVALKRILAEDGGDSRRRERFRREARSAARLSHPAIVQVYDFLETDQEDWIVMELVEGRTLASLLREGPLGMGRVLALARQIAEGLGEAHAKGILHRDLKPENVMVAPGGHAKILDFGLAKRYWPAAGEEPVSIEGQIAGTGRAMSPEQANGLELDPRSDLFSFGSLLYETVTGVSPFQADTPVETLHRVCAYQPPPASARNPAVPAGLSELIGRLLEKDRGLRPADAAEVAARLEALHGSWLAATSDPSLSGWRSEPTMAAAPRVASPRRRRAPPLAAGSAALLLAALLTFWWLRPREPLYVAVPPPEIGLGKGREEVELAAAGVHSSLLRGLVSRTGTAPLESQERSGSAPSEVAGLARKLAAGEVLTSRLDCARSVCKIVVSRKAADGRLLWVDSFQAPADDFGLLSTAVASALRRAFPQSKPRPGIPELDVASGDYARYLRVRAAFNQGAPLEGLMERAEEIQSGSPRFLEIYLLQADLARSRFFASREKADLDRALSLLRQARALAPGDPRLPLQLFRVQLEAERLAEAAASLAELETLTPGDGQALAWRALLEERRGDPRKALDLMRTAIRRRPSDDNSLALANLEYRQGEIAAARRTLEESLARSPEQAQAQTMLAQLELLSGSPRRAAELYTALARRSPRFAELSNLGLAQILLGDPARAAETFRRAAALAPNSPASALNLADAEQLAGNSREAEALYRKALELTAQDPAGSSFWQSLTIQAQALARLGRRREAVSAIQRALGQAGENPQVAYEAALVYTLVGDRASAVALTERALRGGVERGWFRFPWFDPLRGDPEFAALVGPARPAAAPDGL